LKTRCLDVSGGGGLVELTEAAALEGRAGSCLWIDVEDYTTDDLAEWLRSLGINAESIRACSEMTGRTRVQVSKDDVFFEFSALASPTIVERVPLAFLCRPGMCITLHLMPVEGLHENVDHLMRNSTAPGVTVSSVVATVLAGLSTRTLDAFDDLSGRVLAVQERMDRDPDRVEVEDIQRQSGAIRTLEGIVGEHVVVFDRLRVLETPTLDLADLAEFRMALADARYLDRAIDRLEKHVSELRVRFTANQQDRTNHRLAVLTVLSAIFLPLTLMAGIWGMNFEFMPELGYRYAYPIALGAMVVISIGAIVYFYSRGWFD